MTTYYLVSAVLMLVIFLIIAFRFEAKKVNYYFLIITFLTTISNMGYMGIAFSKTLEEAILANKICYIGGCFVPPIILLLVFAICNYKVPRWVLNLMFLYNIGVYLMVMTIGYTDLYYDEMHLDKFGNATVLAHTYGIGHSFFYIILYGYIIFQAIVLIYTLVKKKPVSQKNLWLLILLLTINILSFIGSKAMNPYFEVMPFLYVVDGLILLYLHRRASMYNVEDNVNTSLRNNEIYGYIMFDNRYNYLGSNDVAIQIFPEITKCAIDSKPNVEILLNWLNEWKENETFNYVKDEKHYECSIERIRYKGKPCGYMIEMREDTDNWKYLKLLSSYNTELEKMVEEQIGELREKQEAINSLFIQTVTALSEAVDAKDRYTSGHSKRVAIYSRMIAARMGKSEEEQEEIYRAGLLHDVGKIRIPVEIINKAGKLTDEEYNIIKIHPVTGYYILRNISSNSMIAIASKYHHERYDGKGYPNGLIGEKIPEIARIMGVADSYDAMTSNRSYRKALPQEVVRGEIEKGRGTQFDPQIADIMLAMIDEDKEYNLRQADSLHRKILVVDDEEINNKLIKHIMKDETMYEIVSTCQPREGLELLKEQAFDLVLLDVKMPDIDGLEMLKLIRENNDIPVVMMTADKTLDELAEFEKLGCNDFITKPFSPLLIREVIYNMTK